jgi:hypothetical protein
VKVLEAFLIQPVVLDEHDLENSWNSAKFCMLLYELLFDIPCDKIKIISEYYQVNKICCEFFDYQK